MMIMTCRKSRTLEYDAWIIGVIIKAHLKAKNSVVDNNGCCVSKKKLCQFFLNKK